MFGSKINREALVLLIQIVTKAHLSPQQNQNLMKERMKQKRTPLSY